MHFLLIYPLNTAPSQRFRFEQYFYLFEGCKLNYTTDSFYDDVTFALLYGKGKKIQLGLRLLLCYLRRLVHLFSLGQYDCILIQRGAAPIGPPIFEWFIKAILRKPIIYDFDDAIWLAPSQKGSFFKSLIKSNNKVGKICSWAHTVVVGNQYLAAYAKKHSDNVVLIPTVVDTENKFFPQLYVKAQIPVIGWTGSHTTLPYLEALERALLTLKANYDFTLMVMANKEPNFSTLPYIFIKWSEEVEVSELNKIDIGIMPLPDDEWTKGKCGFKAIQYMALGKPAVASAVGVNTEIIDHGVNGYLCSTTEDWIKYLGLLLSDKDQIAQFGVEARKKAHAHFSIKKAAVAWSKVLQNA